MNIRYSIRRITTVAATALAVLQVAAPARADQLSPSLYADQLARCSAELRAELATPATARLQHELTAVDRTRLWYVFDIRSTASDADGNVTDRATTTCRAHRWTDETVADVTHAPQTADAAPRVAVTER